jgi:hypothetical protein
MHPVTLPPEPSEHGLTKRPVVDLGAYFKFITHQCQKKHLCKKETYPLKHTDKESHIPPSHLERGAFHLQAELKLL